MTLNYTEIKSPVNITWKGKNELFLHFSRCYGLSRSLMTVSKLTHICQRVGQQLTVLGKVELHEATFMLGLYKKEKKKKKGTRNQ